ncbi:rho GTPase-activating protein 12-like isoform X2 [Paramormyrops kingsleyae]|uniref:rho GTPase-activating protein 12-like isoform X2 n=1 Tax=Paramormyrops kingsleyae TaxID=1676925 RepID=UPI003B96A164
MADRDDKAEMSIAPGQPYIEVEYEYEYKAKDRVVTIKPKECYMLVKKTNVDWWQVKKDEGSKPFYVPAQYVREVRKALMPPPKALPQGGPIRPRPATPDLSKPNDNLNKPTAHLTPPTVVKDINQNPASSGHGKGSPDPLHHGSSINSNGGSLPRQRAKSPSSDRKVPLDILVDVTAPTVDSDKHYHDLESGDELSSSPTDPMQSPSPLDSTRPDSPVYSNLQDLKLCQSSQPPRPSSLPLQTAGDWETHRDATGRHFYYNRCTQERSWKPPRSRESSTKGDSEVLRRLSTRSSQSDSQYGSLRGWSEELDEHGQTLYISDHTSEKWMKHVDDQGRSYYYNTDGSRSEWELPKLDPPNTHSGNSLKTQSLDRKLPEPIVLNRWRHSTCILEANDKESPSSPKGIPDSDWSPLSPRPLPSPSEKCGVLNVTKITENGKKVRKNWTSSWTVLHGSSLLFAKGQGGGTSWFGSSQSKPEFTVDLRGASIEWAKQKSSKKNVIELKTRQGTELLIQLEHETSINEWYKALSETISAHAWESDEAIEEDIPESPMGEKPEKEKEKEKDKEQRESRKGRAVKTSVSMESTEDKKTKVKLKKFLTRRPTLQSVRDKGYIKDQVFGCSLTSLCHRENSTVPRFVRMCIEHVEKNGLDMDGLYRVSGNLSVIQKLRFAVNHDEKVDLESSKWEDIHVTTGALKMFFRELAEPLFTYGLFNDFVNAIKSPDYKQRPVLIRDLIKQMPKPNQDTMQVLFKHLRKVIEHGEANRMTSHSVAIVFGPTLLRPEVETSNMAVHMVYQNQIVELILQEYDQIFGSC